GPDEQVTVGPPDQVGRVGAGEIAPGRYDLEGVLGHGDVLRAGEQLPHASGGSRRGRERERCIRLDDHYLQAGLVTEQMDGGGTAHDPGPDDHDVGRAAGHRSSTAALVWVRCFRTAASAASA